MRGLNSLCRKQGMGNLWVLPYERQMREQFVDKANRAHFVQVEWKGLVPTQVEETMKRMFDTKIRYTFDEAYAINYTKPPQQTNYVTFLTVEGVVQGWMWEADNYY